MITTIKENEIVVNRSDFGFLVQEFVNDCLRPKSNIDIEWLNTRLREWWPKLDEYDQRHIQCDIEVALMLDEPPRYSREPMDGFRKFMWQKFIKDFRPTKASFTIDYCCGKCFTRNVKLWRGVHGCIDKDGHELLCAACLAPGVEVNEQGQLEDNICHMLTDQVKGWLPAIPVGDSYWGYSSVPSQDVEWWKALPTYTPKKD